MLSGTLLGRVVGRLCEYGLVDLVGASLRNALKHKPSHHRTFGKFGKLDYSIPIRMSVVRVVGRLRRWSCRSCEPAIETQAFPPPYLWQVRQA